MKKFPKVPAIPISSYNYIFYCSILLLLLPFLAITIYILSGKRFETFDNETPFSLEYYYMEKCHHCVNFTPVWEELKKTVKGKNINLKKYNLTASENSDKVNKYNINSAPTIIFANSTTGEHLEYSGERSIDALVAFINSKTQ